MDLLLDKLLGRRERGEERKGERGGGEEGRRGREIYLT